MAVIRRVGMDSGAGSSLDEKWEEFKAKFDALSKLALEKVFGGGAPTRPSALISPSRVAQVLRRRGHQFIAHTWRPKPIITYYKKI